LLVVAPTSIAAVVVLILVTTSGSAPPPSSELQLAVFNQARLDAPPGSTRVLMAGDTFASSFVSADQPQFDGSDIRGVVEGASGCDVLDDQIAIGTTILPASPPCEYAASYFTAIVGFQPDVAALTFGPSLVFDRVVDGERLDVGTPEHRAWLYEQLDELIESLGRDGAVPLLTTVPCMTPPTTGTYAGLAGPLLDPRRRDAANEDLRAYAEDRDLSIADIGSFLCSHPDYMSDTGVHVTVDGADAAWTELAPIAREAAAADQ
jgi:hypothetical protein